MRIYFFFLTLHLGRDMATMIPFEERVPDRRFSEIKVCLGKCITCSTEGKPFRKRKDHFPLGVGLDSDF